MAEHPDHAPSADETSKQSPNNVEPNENPSGPVKLQTEAEPTFTLSEIRVAWFELNKDMLDLQETQRLQKGKKPFSDAERQRNVEIDTSNGRYFLNKLRNIRAMEEQTKARLKTSTNKVETNSESPPADQQSDANSAPKPGARAAQKLAEILRKDEENCSPVAEQHQRLKHGDDPSSSPPAAQDTAKPSHAEPSAQLDLTFSARQIIQATMKTARLA